MKKSLFGSVLGFFFLVGLTLALSANPSDPKKTETTKGCCSSKAKTEQAACAGADKKASTDKKDAAACKDKKEGAACGEKKAEGAKKSCCSSKKN